MTAAYGDAAVGAAEKSGPAGSDSPVPSESRLMLLLVLMCTALVIVLAANASLTVALPDIGRALGATQTELTWIVNGYALLFAAGLLPAGIVADRFGQRPALATGLGVFGASSIASAFVESPDALIALRVVAGIGATFVMPATLSVLTGAFPAERRASAVAVWAGVAGAGVLLGLVGGGLLLRWFWWGSITLVFGVSAAVLAAVCLVSVPNRRTPGLRLDVPGSLLVMIGLAGVTYGLIEGPETGWTAGHTLLALSVGVAGLAFFVLVESRVTDPMLPVRLFRHRALSVATSMIFLQFAAALGVITYVSQYLQVVRGSSPLEAALQMLPFAVGIGPASQVSPKIVARTGERVVVAGGNALAAAALLVMAVQSQHASYWWIAGALVAFGAGFGLSTTPATTMIMEGLPADRRTLASAVNDAAREVGGAIGIAVFATSLETVYRNRVAGFTQDLPSPVADAVTNGVNSAIVAGRSAGPTGTTLIETAQASFYHGYQIALAVGGGFLLAAATICAVVSTRGTQVTEERASPFQPERTDAGVADGG
jgi:EmrB/QacA subfamily drug resistance transporter